MSKQVERRQSLDLRWTSVRRCADGERNMPFG